MPDIAPLAWSRLLTCLLCGFLIGIERQLRGKPVGIRTSSLIILGSYCFLELSCAISPQAADQARVLGQLVTGIGFLGAGVMMTQNGVVIGATSAATVWVLAALGAMIGLNLSVPAIVLTFFILGILVGVDWLERKFVHLQRGVHKPFGDRHGAE